MKINGQHVLITGANRGIGHATALMMAKEGAHLHLANRTTESTDTLIDEMKRAGAASVRIYSLDLSQFSAIQKFWDKLGDQQIDIVFNNSGQLTGGMLEDQTPEEIDQMLFVNVNALIHMTRFALKGMLKRKSGKIINHSSVSSVMPFPGATTYAASKAAVRAFTTCLQYELSGTGVSALTLITGSIETRMLKEIPTKYGKFLNVAGLQGMEPADYALRIREAILDDRTELLPSGWNLAGFSIASYLPGLYRKGVQARFRRP